MCAVLPWGLLLGKAPPEERIIINLQSSEELNEASTITSSILQTRKLRLKEVKWLPNGHILSSQVNMGTQTVWLLSSYP